ncbi:LOW QUALITY PROTEIN: hypothetical protein KUTeg_013308 [Tegillarca granosa]|uniref:Integrase core domain-containing protein n=1 Tax=Tegillarca granosa TaxID=220873 RepID=A0ABQ9ETB2_TEGGR|nr:LOW QUALITY PROTEIN: hypothetical protein KUTeg_013308 [Tegillarca granosa]
MKRVVRSIGVSVILISLMLFLLEHIETSDQMHGYKFMHLKCIQSGLVVKQETVRVLLQIIDADEWDVQKEFELTEGQKMAILSKCKDSYDLTIWMSFLINLFIRNHNQRIEAWWSHLRSHNVQFWMNMFQTLKNDDHFDGNVLDKNLIRFCFMRIIQDELNGVKNLWYTHRIRRNRCQGVPNGRPLTMYLLPHLYGTHTHICPVSPDSTRVCEEECTYKEPYPCDKDVFDLCCILMHENDLEPPTDSASAVESYKLLRLIINQNL